MPNMLMVLITSAYRYAQQTYVLQSQCLAGVYVVECILKPEKTNKQKMPVTKLKTVRDT